MSKFQAQIAARDGGRFGAYVAQPQQPNGHAMVLLQEIFGVTGTIRKVADHYAEAGYLVLAPDLFWRLEPEIELSHSREDIQRAMSLLERFDSDRGLDDIQATADHIRGQPGFGGKVIVAGLCMGGRLSYLACTRPGFDAGLAFYGVGIEENLDRAADLACPLMLHFGRQDDYVPPAAQARIAAALASQPRATLHFYEGAGHGFYTRGKPEDMALAHQRSLAFLEQQT
ncbi:MAG: dienelactone hydrolase family protein [Pigmentiphaga sp.]|nr:dienelactone hydrolase family protein [Pigmentiphaga sp.]